MKKEGRRDNGVKPTSERKGEKNMKKKVLSMFLTMTMVAGLIAGCGGSDEKTAGDKAATVGTETASGAEEGTKEAVIDFDEDPYQVDIQLTGLFAENNDIEKVEEALNAITLEKINCTVHIVPTFIGDLSNNTSLAVAGGEKIDIVNVGLTQPMDAMVPDGLLLPLDDLLAERGQAALAATEGVAKAQKINGVTYALSGYLYPAIAAGFVYNKTMADEYGIDMHDGMTMEDLSSAAEILKEHDVALTTFGNSGQLNYKFWHSTDSFGDSAAYGAILDPANSTTIENVYASEEFLEFARMIKEWNEAGYLPKEQLTDTTTVQEYFAQQKIFGTATSYATDAIAAWITPNFEAGIVKMSDGLISASSAREFMLGIASTCERPDKAMDLLNLIYSDAEVANLLQYGVEGLDYVAVEGTENVITTEGTENADHNGYYKGFCHFGDDMNLKILAPLTDTYYDDLKTFNDTANISKTFGYNFDASDYSAEAGAIASVLAEKLPMINSGDVEDVDVAVEELVSALQAAGIDDIIAENQKQLDAYLAQ